MKVVDGRLVALTAAEQLARNNKVSQATEKLDRKTKIEEIKQELLVRIGTTLPLINDVEDLELLRKLAPVFQLSGTGDKIKDVYVFAQNKIQQAKTAPINLVRNYNPVSDKDWPLIG